ncbi:hypothetical protein BG015_004667 [Linnemannia schmuckeri]|uniref:Uncharacterized protein n=1 Tax=Linnemannia schmuckeri TaxID=64567 RepID=A0A9P5VCY6_9FUNG|nr:hypothetical protein BG015_004667 [Linnemannia schmuckeri]
MFGLLSNSIFSRQVLEEDALYLVGAAAVKFTILYPAILAAFITMLVNDHGVWIPRHESAVEYIMLVTRAVAGFGGVDVLAAFVDLTYRLVFKDTKACPDVKPAFNWYSIRLDGIFGQGEGEIECDMS